MSVSDCREDVGRICRVVSGSSVSVTGVKVRWSLVCGCLSTLSLSVMGSDVSSTVSSRVDVILKKMHISNLYGFKTQFFKC